MQDLKITLVQADLHWEDKTANLTHLDAMLSTVVSTDVILLPEMFNTGFSMQPSALAENMLGKTIDWMRKTAQRKSAVVCGSLIIEDDGRYFNRLVWMEPDGALQFYDKRHLFSLGGEDKLFSAGQKKIFPEYKDWKTLPLICYDLRFPVWSRLSPPFTEQGANPYHLLIYVANWPDKRLQAWDKLLAARAIENQCYVAAVNRVGIDGHGQEHSGHSCILNAMGEHLAFLDAGEAVTTCTLSAADLAETRGRLPFLADRDEFELRQ